MDSTDPGTAEPRLSRQKNGRCSTGLSRPGATSASLPLIPFPTTRWPVSSAQPIRPLLLASCSRGTSSSSPTSTSGDGSRPQFDAINQSESARLDPGPRADLYRHLKLEGILEAPLNLAATCDHRRGVPFVLGRGPIPATDLYSTCLAVENLWLAARVEGVGVGWVSIIDVAAVARLLGLPDGVELVAYLCVGYPREFREVPMLEEVGWKARTPA